LWRDSQTENKVKFSIFEYSFNLKTAGYVTRKSKRTEQSEEAACQIFEREEGREKG
jgi:hypothetical protein